MAAFGVGLQLIAADASAQQRPPCFCYFSRPTDAQEKRCKDLGFPSRLKLTWTVSCRDDATYPFAVSGLLSDQSGFFSKYSTVKAVDDSRIEIVTGETKSKVYSFQLIAWDMSDSREPKSSSTGAAQGAVLGGFLFGLPGALLGADIGSGNKLDEQYKTLMVYREIDGAIKSQVLTSANYDETSNIRGFLESASGQKPGNAMGEVDIKKRLTERIALLEKKYSQLSEKDTAKPWCPFGSTGGLASIEGSNIKEEALALLKFSGNIGVSLQSRLASVAGGWNAYLEAKPSLKLWAQANPKQAEALSRCKQIESQ